MKDETASQMESDHHPAPEGPSRRLSLKPARTTAAGRRRRKRALIGVAILVCFYLVAIFAEFLAPYDYRAQSRREPLAPPATPRFRDAQGGWRWRPFIYAQRMTDPLERRYVEQTDRAYPLELFPRGYRYRLLGVFTCDRHLFGVRGDASGEAPRVSLLGTDALGRDRLSRLLVATRFSLVVGPVGALLAAALGALLGGVAGYAGGKTDALLMRAADVLMALPTLVLILAARAAFPLELPPVRAGLLLIGIFILLGWAEVARLARGLVLELRRREFALAAESIGCSPARVLARHILPNAALPLIVQASLMLPEFLLAETALSFFGAGLQEPEPSWGNMLAAASDITLFEREHALVLLAPAGAIIFFVLGVRLISDGLNQSR
jgi:peptide/nickel transport system permease protein